MESLIDLSLLKERVRILESVVLKLSEVEGHVSIDGGVAAFPGGTSTDLSVLATHWDDSKGQRFKLYNKYGAYRDYEAAIRDVGGIGGVITITLVDENGEKPRAYGNLVIDTEDGESLVEVDFEISRQKAELLCLEKSKAKGE